MEACIKYLDLREIELAVKLVDQILGESYIRWLNSQEIEACYSDDLSWLPESFDLQRFTADLTRETVGLKVFHGCRPESVDMYYQNGFLSAKTGWLKETFDKIFPEIDAHIKHKVFGQVNSLRADENVKTYFICDTERLVNGGSGHYLVYGSEFLLNATRLLEEELNEPLIHQLKMHGTPTVFEVNLPYSVIPENQVKELACLLLEVWGKWHLFPQELYRMEFVVITRGHLSAEHIVGHYHPEKIMDRIQWPPMYYYFKTQEVVLALGNEL
ncbi:TPA: hypothetical protein NJ357_004419 [Vibrio parahaemolyticus]|nr:hypothetical protein [Vibrio parahaemolyticus]HCE3194716.1 hypothetical protein [Vibrio parahaemolyticus]HCG7142025.1 hypothetical protein [Vibrio parahaemolyticus]HCG8196472.1 hypothetical protein [Vibrio parahaemolyticus]